MLRFSLLICALPYSSRGLNRLLPSRYLSFRAENHEGPSEEEQKAARTWLASYNPGTIPRSLCDMSFSRSSGPGGQNVNKYDGPRHIYSYSLTLTRTNSKATLRLSLKDLLPLIPSLFHEQLRSSRYYAERSDALIIQADGSRRQTDNVQECHNKLEDLLMTVGRHVVRGESTPSQIAKVKRLYVISS